MTMIFGIILLKFSIMLKEGNVMPKFFVKNNQITGDKISIIGEDVNHIINVLRMKKDDEIMVCDSDNGINYLSNIIEFDKAHICCKIKEKLEESNESNINLTLFQGIPKFDKMELIIQKCTEIGVKSIVPVEMIRCIAKVKDNKKIDRWNKIAQIASKQSLRDIIPEVSNPIKVGELIEKSKDYDLILVAYEKEEKNTLKKELKKFKDKENLKIGIIIGPEGGIEKSEIEILKKLDNVKIVTLGKRILRTETAGLVLACNIIYELEL